MTNNENEMRAQFEAWVWSKYGQLLWWDMNYSDVFRRDGESYLTEFLSVRWEGWQASRQALVIPLPDDGIEDCRNEIGDRCRDTFDCGYNYASLQHERAIESQGVKCK